MVLRFGRKVIFFSCCHPLLLSSFPLCDLPLQGNGGIEGKGFDDRALYDVILPMAAGLDSWLYWNNSCSFNEIVARAMSRETLDKVYSAVEYAQKNGANWTNVPASLDLIHCLHAWQTDGLSNWMANFVAPVSAADGLNAFSAHVRFNPTKDSGNAQRLYNSVVFCSQIIWSTWLHMLTSSQGTGLSPLQRVQQAQQAALATLNSAMQGGKCGAPSY